MFHLSLASYKTTFTLFSCHSGFCIIWFYCIIFYIEIIDILYRYFIECFIEIYFSIHFMVFQNGKWSEVIDSQESPALFLCPQKLVVLFIQISSVHWMNYFSNRRFAKVTSHWVWETRKITEFSALLFVKSCLPPVDY